MTAPYASCGTEAAYQRHRRNSETPDRACLAASTAARRARKRKRALPPQDYVNYLLRETVGVLAGLMAHDRNETAR